MSYDAFSKCHPLTNFLFFLGAIGFSVVIQHPAYLAASCICAGLYLVLLRGRKGIGVVLGMLPLFLALTVFNSMFNTHGSQVLFRIFGRPYTLEALYHGMAVSGIFVSMLLWFGCYSAVLTSDKFVCLFGSLIPSLSLLLVMVLRMIPNLMRKVNQVSGARQAIGKGVAEEEGIRAKLSGGMAILSALTDWALEGGIVTADSMRARGYGSARRTSFQRYRLAGRDLLLLGSILCLGLTVVLAGGTEATYTPQLCIAAPGWGLLAYWAFLLIPSVMHIKEALQWHISVSRI